MEERWQEKSVKKNIEKLRPNGIHFRDLQVEKRLVPKFEPNRSPKTTFVVRSKILRVYILLLLSFLLSFLWDYFDYDDYNNHDD